MLRFPVVLLLSAALQGAVPGNAQDRSAVYLDAARTRIDRLEPDTAASLLGHALRMDLSPARRVRGYTLLGVAELMRGRKGEARAAFRTALEIDPKLNLDSLGDLQADVVAVFRQAQKIAAGDTASFSSPLPPPSGARVRIYFPQDVTLRVGESFPVQASVSFSARLQISVARLESPTLTLWSASFEGSDVQTARWDLRSRNGMTLGPGSYLLRVDALDSAGTVHSVLERQLNLSFEITPGQARTTRAPMHIVVVPRAPGG